MSRLQTVSVIQNGPVGAQNEVLEVERKRSRGCWFWGFSDWSSVAVRI